jgi:hypothetical protein
MSENSSQQKKVLLVHLDWNLQRLEEVLKQGNTEYFKGAALQRFGHTYTMAIKCISGFGEAQDINDEECIDLAKKSGWIENMNNWQEMQADFKSINQESTGPEAEVIYQKLSHYQQVFKSLYLQMLDSLPHG